MEEDLSTSSNPLASREELKDTILCFVFFVFLILKKYLGSADASIVRCFDICLAHVVHVENLPCRVASRFLSDQKPFLVCFYKVILNVPENHD